MVVYGVKHVNQCLVKGSTVYCCKVICCIVHVNVLLPGWFYIPHSAIDISF